MGIFESLFSGLGVHFLEKLEAKVNNKEKIKVEVKVTPETLNLSHSTDSKKINDPILIMYQRIINTLTFHEISISQFVEFMGEKHGFSYNDVRTPDNFIEKMTPRFVEAFCETFNIRKEWIEGQDEIIYKSISVYDSPRSFRKLLFNIGKKHQKLLSLNEIVDIVAFKSCKELIGDNTIDKGWITFIIGEKIGKVNDTDIYKYYIIEPLLWKHWRARKTVKIIFAICDSLRIDIPGRTISYDDMLKLGYGRCFPYISSKSSNKLPWFPEDYINGFGIPEIEAKDRALNNTNLDRIKEETIKERDELVEQICKSSRKYASYTK
ncbi:hypothetical protein [Wukongibacter baidiensis]